MVLAPFFLALGAFGGGLFVASPCVTGVVVCRGVCRRERCVATCGGALRRCATASEGPLRAVAAAFVCGPARTARRCVATCGGGRWAASGGGGAAALR